MDQGHGIIAWIIIGVVAGWATGKIMKGSGFGFFVDMIVGLVGALVGGFLSEKLGLGGVGEHGLIMSIVIAVLGAVILTWLGCAATAGLTVLTVVFWLWAFRSVFDYFGSGTGVRRPCRST